MTKHSRIGELPLTIIESPFSAPTIKLHKRNIRYARLALIDSINRGEAPFAGHLLYPQVLDDLVPEQRAKGISLHIEFIFRADRVAVYPDHGISAGMREAMNIAERLNKEIVYRHIPNYETEQV